MIIKYFHFCIIILAISCTQKNKSVINDKKLNGVSNDTIPPIRNIVNTKPVASYIITMGNPRLDRKFGAEVFETPETFKYLLVMYYDGTIENYTLSIPNFGIWPTVKIKPGNEKLSCIIGFLDIKNNFREYKMISTKNHQLKLSSLKTYGVATYYK